MGAPAERSVLAWEGAGVGALMHACKPCSQRLLTVKACDGGRTSPPLLNSSSASFSDGARRERWRRGGAAR